MNAEINVKAVLTPSWGENCPESLNIIIELDGTQAKSGEKLVKFNKRTVNREFNRLLKPIKIFDDYGSLEFKEVESVFATHYLLDEIIILRDVIGTVRIEYAVAIDEGLPNPVFDLGSEPGGAMGSGTTFMPEIPADKLHVTLRWDLSKLPVDCAAAWTYGRGDSSAITEGNGLQFAGYAFGKLRWVEEGNFGFYWFDAPGFDGKKIGQWTASLISKMATFFDDKGGDYRIFTRHKSEPAGQKNCGGTALLHSYLWIYYEDNPPGVDELRHLFPHEAVHNWITLGRGDEPFGTCTWYVEGTAEYYSALLPYRYGLIDRKELIELLNQRCREYYSNPKLHDSNLDCGALLMKDLDATRIPYGRGFFYLTGVDEQIRKATNGQKNLDNVVLEILRLQRTGVPCDNETWLELAGKLTGRDMRPEFNAMAAGELVTPHALCFGEEICVEECVDERGSLSFRYEVCNEI